MSEGETEALKAAWNEAHRIEQMLAGLAATPAQRLDWLEDAIAFAHAAGALPREEPVSPDG